jgi:hypothetical protein
MKQTPAYDIVNDELLSLILAYARRIVDVDGDIVMDASYIKWKIKFLLSKK